jgi:hypothetical protein
MGLHYTVTPHQWETLNKEKSPRPITERERESLEKLYKRLVDNK